jgi:CelD/BcsL family acetyltransferase involved in cellulose biosynthesis
VVIDDRPRVLELRRLGLWAAQWDELAGRAQVPTPFARSWWLDAVADERACFVLVVSGDRLLAGLALEQRRLGGVVRWRFCGAGKLCPDHLDLLVAPGHIDAVGAALRDWLRGPGRGILDLDGLVVDSLLARVLGGARIDVIAAAPSQPLDGQRPFLHTRSGSFRREVGRNRRRLAELPARHRQIDKPELDVAMRSFAGLHASRTDRQELLDELPRLSGALAAGLACGEACIDVLEIEQNIIAAVISFRVEGRLCVYQSARSLAHEHRNAVTVLLADIVERARTEGCTELDLLRGTEAYKRNFADQRRAVLRLRAASGTPARAGLVLMTVVDAARASAGRVRVAVQRASERSGRSLRRTAP